MELFKKIFKRKEESKYWNIGKELKKMHGKNYKTVVAIYKNTSVLESIEKELKELNRKLSDK